MGILVGILPINLWTVLKWQDYLVFGMKRMGIASCMWAQPGWWRKKNGTICNLCVALMFRIEIRKKSRSNTGIKYKVPILHHTYQTSEGLLAARLLQQLSVPKPVQSPQDLFTSIDLNTLYPNILNMSNLYWCGSMNYLLMVKHTHINSDWDKIYLLFLVGVGVPCELNP
jgi:hypothetical protein